MRIVNPSFGIAPAGAEQATEGKVDWRNDPIVLFGNSKPNARELLEGVKAKLASIRRVDASAWEPPMPCRRRSASRTLNVSPTGKELLSGNEWWTTSTSSPCSNRSTARSRRWLPSPHHGQVTSAQISIFMTRLPCLRFDSYVLFVAP